MYKRQGMFSIMNYMNPLRGIASMHCSANTNMEGTSSAIFFGLSGTGKTTLSLSLIHILNCHKSVLFVAVLKIFSNTYYPILIVGIENPCQPKTSHSGKEVK